MRRMGIDEFSDEQVRRAEEATEDVKVASDYSNGHYNGADIKLAVVRTILYRLGVCV